MIWNEADRFEESVPVCFAAASLFKKKGDLTMMSYCVADDDVTVSLMSLFALSTVLVVMGGGEQCTWRTWG